MTRRTLSRSAFVAGALGLMLASAAPPTGAAAIEFRFGTRSRPLSGQRYETMRRLAARLDDLAEHAAREAREGRTRGTAAEASLLGAMGDFSRRASAFRTRIDRSIDSAVELPNEVLTLERSARRVDNRLARGRVPDHVRSDWAQVTDTVDRMKQLLSGGNVTVPYGWSGTGALRGTSPMPFDTSDPRMWLGGGRVEQAKRLIHELDDRVTRSRAIAEDRSDRDRRNRRFYDRIRDFAEKVDRLHRYGDEDRIAGSELRPIVEELLADARDVDRSLRDSGAFPELWDEWSGVVSVLDRLDDLSR